MSKAFVNATWDDVPHLSEAQKAELLKSYPPYQRKARSEGIPSLGAGAIYPIDESEIKVKPFPLPRHWPRVYALDVGWKRTAALWGAIDRETLTTYLYSEHYRAEAEPSVHAAAIRARGDWIPGVIDPAARGRGQKDGEILLQMYKDLGLNLKQANNSREAGLLAVWEMLSTGRLKAFNNLENFFDEYRLYRRDEKGQVVKENDHLMDDLRYMVVSGLEIAIVKPVERSHRQIRTQASNAGY